MNKKQLSNINKFKKSSLPIIENVLIEPGKLTVTDLEVSYIVNHSIPVNDKCLISIEEFVKIARKYTIDEIVASNGRAVLVTGAGNFSFESEDIEEFPDIPSVDNNTGYKITKETIDTYSSYMSKDDLRPAMCGIYFGDGICATDGHRLRYDLNAGPGGELAFILRSEAVALITQDEYLHHLSNDEKESYESAFFALKSENETIIYNEVCEKYVNFRAVIPTEFTQTFKFDSKEAKKYIEAALITANKTTKQIRLQPDENTIRITAQELDLNKEYKSKTFGTVSNVESEEFQVGFNGGYFLDMLKNNPGKIEMKQGGANRAAVINGRELIMPVMLSA